MEVMRFSSANEEATLTRKPSSEAANDTSFHTLAPKGVRQLFYALNLIVVILFYFLSLISLLKMYV